MSLNDFIKDALYKPSDYIAYHVTRELAQLDPNRAVVYGDTGFFDIDPFVLAGHCSVVEQKSVFNQTRTDWMGTRKKLRHRTENSWLNVLWKGVFIEVVLITWHDGCHRCRHHWIIADERKIAENFFQTVCDWNSEVRAEILIFQDGDFSKDKQLFDSIRSATFENLILPDALRQQIHDDFRQFFDAREIYDRYGIAWKRGAIFIGPPGNGKTHTLKALINELGKPCLYVRSFKSEYETEPENMAHVFRRARMMSPCLLVLEDLDSMIDGENRSFLLNELDGFHSNAGLVVLATTNYPEKLDSAIMERPSRFDRKYFFELPAEAERRAYVSRWNRELQPEMRLSGQGAELLVTATDGFSFAYLKELFVASMVQWLAAGGTEAMEGRILSQAASLREQMNSKPG